MKRTFAYNFQIHCVDKQGDIIETIGEMNHFGVAKAAFEAALGARTNSKVELRECYRVVEAALTGSYDPETKLVPILERIR